MEANIVSQTTTTSSGTSLARVLKTRHLVIFGIVFMAPVSAQGLFGELTVISQGHAVLSYLLGLIAMIFTAFCYGKMAGAFPTSGSTYNYTSKAIHPNLGFMAGWAILLDYMLIPMLVVKVGALYSMEIFSFVPIWVMVLVFLLPVTISNFLGAEVSSRVNTTMTIFMFISVVTFIGFAINALIGGTGTGSVFSLQGIINPDTFSMDVLVAGASIATLSYLGFDAVTTMAEDSRVTGKMVGLAAVVSLLISAFFYILQVYFATIIVPDFNSFASTMDTAFFEIATLVGGGFLAALVTAVLAIAGIATGIAGQASSSRILFAMGRDKLMPRFFAHLHPKFKTPDYSIILLFLVNFFGAVFIPLGSIFGIIVFGGLIGFICVNFSVIVEFFFRRKERSGKHIFANLLFPIIGVLVCGYILIGMATVGKIVGVSWLIVGFILLLITTKGFKKEVVLNFE